MKHLKQMELTTSTLSQEDILANPSQLQDLKKVKKIRDTSGQSILDLSKNSDQLGLLEKMLVDTLNKVSTPCSKTWKVKVTPQGRLVFQLLASAQTTKEKESGFWRTPDAHCGRGPSSKERMQMKLKKGMPISLNDQVAHPNLMWPTPRASSAMAEDIGNLQRRGTQKGRLEETVAMREMWPTPSARDYKGQNSMKHIQEKPRHNSQLPNRLKQRGITGQLNPTWVEWLMGYPTGWTDLNR